MMCSSPIPAKRSNRDPRVRGRPIDDGEVSTQSIRCHVGVLGIEGGWRVQTVDGHPQTAASSTQTRGAATQTALAL